MNISEEVKDKIIAVLFIVIVVLLIIILYVLSIDNEDPSENYAILNTNETTTTIATSEEFYVDIKGAVKKPGVYLVKKGSIINDVIKLAGGLKSNAYTQNINLSQATHDEMVIYIFTKAEIKKTTTPIQLDTTCKTEVIEVNNCITTTTKVTQDNNENSTLININTATLEQLTTLSGVGESKAKAIISYREETPFTSIEDLKNVSGIGDSLYATIKDNITV